MKIKVLFITLIFLSLTACAGGNKRCADTQNYTPAINAGNYAPQVKYVPVPVKGQLMRVKNHKAPRLVGEEAIRSANKKAVRQPTSGEYINSIMTFDYMPGALYQIYCAPLSVTDVQFEDNEHIISVGAGDTLRWQVSKTFSGMGATRHEHLLIKPVDEGLTNSIVVTTDFRTYHLMLHSTEKTYMASVAWRYPDGNGSVLQNLNDTQNLESYSESSQLNLNNLDCNYQVTVVSGQRPDWLPKMVFNDGNKTYIKFPSHMQQAPTLFIGNSVKTDQLINYRVQGDYYVIDSLFPEAQLRSGQIVNGQNNQIVVQISYKNSC
jgi:type IV secretion system protein TrbG